MAKARITTPHPVVDVGTAISSLAPKGKTTVRLHPRQGEAAANCSKIGGSILWPKEEKWPICADHDCPYVAALQLRKQDVPEIVCRRGTNLLQVLWCPNRHSIHACPDVKVLWRNSRINAKSPDCIDLTRAERKYIPTPCVVHPESVIEFPDGAELSQQDFQSIESSNAISDALADPGVKPIGNWTVPNTNIGMYFSWLSVAPGTKIGGYPAWLQDPEYPRCDSGHKMEFLMSFASLEFDGQSWGRWLSFEERDILTAAYDERSRLQCAMGCSFGDAGNLYVFICRECPQWPICAFTQSC